VLVSMAGASRFAIERLLQSTPSRLVVRAHSRVAPNLEANGGEVMRCVGYECVEQMDTIVREHGPNENMGDVARRIASDLRGRYLAFCKSNPTPLERIKSNDEQREITRRAVTKQGERLKRAFGLA
jgi:hypothetical protein